MKKTALVAGILFVIFIVGFLFFHSTSPPFIVISDPIKPSKDQQRLISNFGYPDTFALATNKEGRLEVWKYYGLERSFVFKNGTFINDQIIDPLASLNAYPKLRPTQFKKGLTLAETSKIIDSEPTVQAEIIPEIVEEAQVYSYSDQVIVGVQEDKVVFIQTLPVKTE